MRYRNQTVIVLGLGVSGIAAAGFLLRNGAKVLGIDKRINILQHDPLIQDLCLRGMKIACEDDHIAWDGIQLVVVSPGVPHQNPIYAKALALSIEIIGEIELACRELRQPCLAVTGSNGKTTTAMLVEHALNYNNKPAKALGNIGTPLIAAAEEVKEDEVVVLELSSWQLETLKTRAIDCSAVLNITPNHLDRHGTMEAYAKAKLNLISATKQESFCYINRTAAEKFKGLYDPSYVKTFGFDNRSTLYSDTNFVYSNQSIEFELPDVYKGKHSHHVENIMAAYGLCRYMGIAGESFREALESFKRPSHRIEFVRKINGVAYYNDSKGTNVDAVVKAVLSMEGPSYLIAGGVHKGASYKQWINDFSGKVACVCAIGEAAEIIKQDIGHSIPVETFFSLEEALGFAKALAKEGENILLSPGCSSYDMFRNYEHRGDEFKRIVNAFE